MLRTDPERRKERACPPSQRSFPEIEKAIRKIALVSLRGSSSLRTPAGFPMYVDDLADSFDREFEVPARSP
jgi:hypothetical protein